MVLVVNARVPPTKNLTEIKFQLTQAEEAWSRNHKTRSHTRPDTPYHQILRLADALNDPANSAVKKRKLARLLYEEDDATENKRGDANAKKNAAWDTYKQYEKLYEYFVKERGYLLLLAELTEDAAETKRRERKRAKVDAKNNVEAKQQAEKKGARTVRPLLGQK